MTDASSTLTRKNEKTSYFSIVSPFFLLFIAALLIRLAGILWGSVHADEAFNGAVKALAGQIVPDTHYYPPLLYYMAAVAFGAMYALGRTIGVWWDLADFRTQYFQDPTPFIYTARLLVSCMGAAAAPLAALIARQLQIPLRPALIVGGLVGLLPIHLITSHVFKVDIALSSALLLTVWAFLRKVAQPDAKYANSLLGVSVALALSFKQSALFILLPLLIGYVFLMRTERQLKWKELVQSLLSICFFSLIFWIPFNIGILLDLKNYLEFQKVLGLMWTESNSNMFVGLFRFTPTFIDLYQGATAPVFILWLLVPFIRRDRQTLVIWVSTLCAICIQAYISGGNHIPSHLLPYSVLMALLAGVGAATLLNQSRSWRSWRVIPLLVMLVCVGIGALGVIKQATDVPLHRDLTVAIEEIATPGKTRILSAFTIDGLPLDPKVPEDTYKRHQRLAKKYGVYIPPMAKDRESANQAFRTGFYVQSFPWVIGRLERYSENEVKVVKLYSWPIQPEEWQLEYWLNKGFSIFIVNSEAEFLKSDIPEYRQFHRQIHDQCKLYKNFQPRKPLFWETEVGLYQCAGFKENPV